jgi:hypothetical protein
MKTTKFLLALAFFSIISCSKSSDDTTQNQPSKMLLKKEYTNKYSKTYEYDSNNNLIKITQLGDVDPSITSGIETITYNSNGKIGTILREYIGTTNYSWKDSYTYQNDKVIQINMFKKNQNTGQFEAYQQDYYVYVSDNVFDINSFREVNYDYRTRYTLTNGNLTQIDQYKNITQANTQGTYDFTGVYSNFDAKNFIYSSLPKEYKYETFINSNNHGKFQSGNYVETLTYEYNADNYPIKKTDNLGNITNYEYTKI